MEKLLLKGKLENIPQIKRKDFLINCITKHHKFYEKEVKEVQIPISQTRVCQLCKSDDFIKDVKEATEICQNCGTVRPLVPTQKIFEKIEYITPGSHMVHITKDGKKTSVDLNKINLWLQETDPLAVDTKKILDNLEIIYSQKSLDLPKSVKNTTISLWYNFNSLRNASEKYNSIPYNKKGVLCLCIYYGSSINGYIISLQQLSLLFDVNVTEIIKTNIIFKNIFSNTEYYKYLVLNENTECVIALSIKNKLLFNKIKADLIKNFPSITDPLGNKEYSGIIYYITNKINPIIKYTLIDLAKRCNISTTSISSFSKSVEQFYKSNPKLYQQLLI